MRPASQSASSASISRRSISMWSQRWPRLTPITALLSFMSLIGWNQGSASTARSAASRFGVIPVAALREPEADEPPERRQAAIALAEGAGGVEDDVDAAAAGDAPHLHLEVLASGSRWQCATPASRSTACFAADAVPITSAPAMRQSWMAAMPTPPAAAWTSTFSPACTLPKCRSIEHGGEVVHRNGGALLEGQASGSGNTCAAGTTTTSA